MIKHRKKTFFFAQIAFRFESDSSGPNFIIFTDVVKKIYKILTLRGLRDVCTLWGKAYFSSGLLGLKMKNTLNNKMAFLI